MCSFIQTNSTVDVQKDQQWDTEILKIEKVEKTTDYSRLSGKINSPLKGNISHTIHVLQLRVPLL